MEALEMVWGQPSLFGAFGNQQGINGYGPSISGTGFMFRKRTERLDWRLLASVDIDRIAREVDLTALQDNISNITFCNIERELDFSDVDSNFVKVYKLAQFTIEYLLHSQDYLHNCIEPLQEKIHKHSEQLAEATKQLEKQSEEMKALKKENRRKKKLLAEQQQQMVTNPSIDMAHKCAFCDKAFIAASYVQSHILRRHSNMLGVGSNAPGNKTLEADLKMMKERLEAAEQLLEKERCSVITLAEKEEAARLRSEETSKHEMREWKAAQDESHHREVEQVKDMLLREIKEMHEKYSASQEALAEFRARMAGQQSHLGELRDTEEESQQKHHAEIAALTTQLHAEVRAVQADMERQLVSQEKNYRAALKQMRRQHDAERAKLGDLLAEQQRTLSEEQGQRSSHYDEQRRELLRQTRQQEALIRQQQRALDDIRSRPAPPQPQPQPEESEESSAASEEEEEEEVDDSLRTNEYGMLRSGRMIAALRKQPGLLTGVRAEMLGILNASLEDRGVRYGAVGIGDSLCAQRLAELKLEGQRLARKHDGFFAVREQFARRSDAAAKRRRRARADKAPAPVVRKCASPNARAVSGSPGERRPANGSLKPARLTSGTPKKNALSLVSNATAPTNFSNRWSKSDSDDNEEEEQQQQQQSERPRGIAAVEASADSPSGWDDSASELEEATSSGVQDTRLAKHGRSPVAVARMGSSGVVAELTKSIERQLKGKSPGGKPKVPPRSPRAVQPDSDTDFSLSSAAEEEEDPRGNPRPKPRSVRMAAPAAPPAVKPRRSSSAEPESTYGTSVWGSSRGSAVTLNAPGGGERQPTNHRVSTSWDSDGGDLDIEDLGVA
ncbi:PREDICTED: zinc finger protein DZIP1L-like [Priapulus caudatus]|uniref:Zinc finger protein DZIP1L-like n=1 Tax=Priapulus caudatus TaxID=37621 RepID=A0ABM1EXB1_PRICU|nr:PREDICTED: zinc finger protein DZIP1L-like [Priapulus caudatus]